MRTPRRGPAWFVAAVPLLAIAFMVVAGPIGAVERDPVEGKWLGTAGAARERITVGLEFRRNAQGSLGVLVTQPISNYFSADPGGNVLREADTVKVEALALSLRLDGDTLEGTYPGPNSKANFHRVKSLPSELAPPKVPSGPAPKWQTRVAAQLFASPVVAEGVIYIGSSGGVFNALSSKDGKLMWTFSCGRPILGAAAVDGDAVYFVCDDGNLYKLNRGDGKALWHYALGDGDLPRVFPHPQVYDFDWQAPRPLVHDGAVYVGSGDGGFHAVDAQTGARRWRFDTRGKIRTGAAIDGARVVVGSTDHFVYSLDTVSGKELWRSDTGAEIDADPLIANGKVVIGNRGGGLYSLDAQTGAQDWRLYFWGSWVESTATMSDGVIYIGSSDLRRVSAIDPAEGHVLWRSDVYGWSWGTPLVTQDRIYVGAAGGNPYFVHHVASFTALERSTGKILTRWPLPDSGGFQWGIAGSPALSGDSVIVATIAGSVLAFPLR